MSPIHDAYIKHGAALKRFLWRYYKRAEDVEDAAQEAFLRAFKAESSKAIKSPKEFLFQTAKHYALSDLARHENTKTRYLADSDVSPVLQDENQIGADDRMAGRQELAALVEAVAQLPPQCRRVFMLRKFDGLKVKDIAKRLNISVSSVEKHIGVGLVKCADYLAERGHDAPHRGGRSSQPAAQSTAHAKTADRKSDD